MAKKIFKSLGVLAAVLFLGVSVASAHVSVKPSQAGIGSFQTFTLNVPSEREAATVMVRLVLPEGLGHVTPTVKPGWQMEMKHAGEQMGEGSEHENEGPVTEIIWRGGSIPGFFRDEFSFSTQVPASETKLAWKAYQHYADGSRVAWELAPGSQEQPKNAQGQPDFSAQGPYSMTAVVNDLQKAPVWQEPVNIALGLSTLSILLSALALFRFRRR
jgi:uncharacterized protein YcnI